MAKLAVFLFAAFAITAALAGSKTKHMKYDSTYDVERFDWKQGNDLDQYLMQLRTISKDVTDRVHDFTPTDKLYMKTLFSHCRVLSKYFDSIIEKLEKDMSYGKGVETVELKQFFTVLRDIQMTLRQVDELSFEQLKYTFNMSIQKYVEQIEKLVRYTQGSLTSTIKYVLVDFITIIQNIDYQLKTFGHKEYTLVQLSMEIRELTRDLTKYLQDSYFNNVQVKQTLRQYLHHLELLKNQHQLDTVLVDKELIVLFDQMYEKLYEIIVPFTQTSQYERFVNTDVLKREFITELETISEDIYKYVQHYETKYQGTERYWIIEKVLKNYLFTIYQLKTDLLKDVKVDKYNKDLYNLYGKTDLRKPVYGLDYHKTDDVYSKHFERGLTMQLYTVLEDLLNYIENLHVDNVAVKETFTHLFRVYISNLETLVEKLDEVYTYKQYEFGTDMKEIIRNLRQYVLSLKRVFDDEFTFNTYELKHHIKIYLGKFTADLEKLSMLWQTNFDESSESNFILKNVIVKFLTATRNFNVHLRNVGQVSYNGQSSFEFGSQIQILARDFIINLRSLSTENIMMKDVIYTRCHEYSRLVQKIIDMLETKFERNTLYHDEVYQRVIMNLRHIVDVLEQVCKHEEISIYKVKEVLITCVENTVTEMKTLLSIYHKYGQEQELQTVLFRMFHDFIVSLKYHQYQLHQVYYTNQHGQDMHQLSSQIQVITHNLVNYFRNVHTYKQEHQEVFVKVIKQELIRSLELVIQRLETEVTYMDKSGVYWEVISEFKRIVDQLREITKYDTLRTEYNMHTELHYVLIDIAKIFERLSYFTESDMQVHENLEQVIRSTLMHYLITIQHLQVQFSQVHYYNQVGKTPSEIVLTIEIICERIQELLRFTVPSSAEKDLSLIVYVRNLYNSMGRIVSHLDENKMGYYNDKYLVQCVENIKKVRSYLEKYVFGADQMEVQQLHIHLRYVVDEIKKMFWVAQYGFQQDVQKYDTVVRQFLDSFLLDLEYFEHYLQVSLQFVRGGLTTRDLYHQIEVVVGRLETIFQYGMSNTGKFRQIVALQVGQYCETIKNLIYILKTEKIFSEERDTLVYDIIVELDQIYARLHRFSTIDNEISTQDLAKEFYLCIRNVAVLLQKLEHGFRTQVDEHHLMEVKVVLDSLFGHYLIAVRNIYIQLDNTKHFGLYQENKDLFNQIQMFVSHLTTSLQFIDMDNEQVKQYFIINTLYYAHRIHVITDKLEFLIKSGKVNFEGIEKLLFDLRQVAVHLQEIGTASHGFTVMEMRDFVIAQIQIVHVEFQKLMFFKNIDIDTVIRGIFIDYYTTVQCFQDRVENLNLFASRGANTEELVYYIENVVYDISYCLRHLTYTDKLVEKTFLVEYRKMYKIVDAIIERFYSMVKVGQYNKIVDQLKDIQLYARKYTTESFSDVYQQRIQFELYLRRVSYIFKQLVWSVRSEYKDIAMIPSDLTDLVRTIMYQFISAVQTTEIQFLNVLESHYVKQYGFEWTRSNEYTTDVLNKNYGQDELYYKRFYPTNKYYGEKVYQTYGVRTQNTWEVVAEIKKVIFDLTKILREDVALVKQDVHVYTVEIRKMIFLVDSIVQKLRMQVRDFEGDRMVLNQVIDRLEATLMSLKRVVEYTTFTGMSQLMKELNQFFFTVVEQFDRLVMIDQEYRGRFDFDLTKVLEEFLMTLQKFKYLFRYGYEHESTYRYSGDYKYGKKYGYDNEYSYNKPTTDMEHKSYGYGKLYDFYYKPYETVNKKYDYELKNDMYKHEDKYTVKQLVEQIRIYSIKVVKDVETVIRDTDSKDVLVYQVRELITILDQIIYKLEQVIRSNKQEMIYQVYENIKDIRRELYEIVHSGVMNSVYQIRSQFTLTIRKISENLVKLVLNSEYYFHDTTFVYEILYQYFGYLRSIHMKWERTIENVDMSHQYKDLLSETPGFSGKVFSSYQVREFTTIVKRIVDKVQTKIYLIKDKELVVLRQVLAKLEYLLKELSGDYVTELKYERLESLVRDVVYEIKSAMTVFEQYGRDYDLYIWCKDILQEFTYPVQKLFYQNKDLVHIWA